MRLAPERIALIKSLHELRRERRQRGLPMPSQPVLPQARRNPILGLRGPLKPAHGLPNVKKLRVLDVLKRDGPLTMTQLQARCPWINVRNAVYDRYGLRRKGLVRHTADGKLAAV